MLGKNRESNGVCNPPKSSGMLSELILNILFFGAYSYCNFETNYSEI